MKTSNPILSIIMGVYNSKNKQLLRKSIDSVLKQTFTDFEFIICDDCSTETEVYEILNYYASIDNRIVLLRNAQNQGLAASLNKCLEVAKGIYIGRQDDDDISSDKRFEIQINYLNENPDVAIVGCNLSLFNDQCIWGERKHKESPVKRDFLYGSQFPHPATVIRKNVIDNIGRYTVSKLTRRTEDYDLYMKLYFYGYKGKNLQTNLYYYYENDITYKQQKFKYRVDEFILRFKWFWKLKLIPKGFVYCFKPLVSGLTPTFIRKRIKQRQFRESSKN